MIDALLGHLQLISIIVAISLWAIMNAGGATRERQPARIRPRRPGPKA